ncbi:hypothetical protein OC861_004345 [Tilletia horrida]|nr:hypothetical protein OC845_004123 [Tilletia horrida]KAK0564347.1 hypothetical protein OC861_004345 [Tilletia horrida]
MSRTPHPLQRSFYNSEFGDPPAPMPQLRNSSAGANSSDPVDSRHAQRSMPPPPSPAPHQMTDLQDGTGPRSASPQDTPAPLRVLSCLSCSRIVGDTESWVEIFPAPLDLLVLGAASDMLTIDTEDAHMDAARDGASAAAPSPSNPSDLPNKTARPNKKSAGPPLHTSPADAPDAGSSWHTLYCSCGYELGRRYVSTTQPHLDALRGNFALSIYKLSYYEVGQYAAGNSGRDMMSRGAPYLPMGPLQVNFTSAEEMNKIRTFLMNVGQRLERLEEHLQTVSTGPSGIAPRDATAAFRRAPNVSVSSSTAPNQGVTAPSSRIGLNRVRIIPNTEDSFLPPRAIPRTTATPAPASGPSIPESAKFSSPSIQNGADVPVHSRAAQPSGPPSAPGPSKEQRAQTAGRQDSSPYSSPQTPTPAPAAVALSQTQKSHSTGTVRTNTTVPRLSSPTKRKASENAPAEASAQKSSQREQRNKANQNDSMEVDDPDSRSQIGTASTKRRRQNSSLQAQQGSSRDHEQEPATRATKGKGRKSEPAMSSQAAVQITADAPNGWPIGVLLGDDDDEDELAIGADASVILEQESDAEEERVAAALGSQGSGKKTSTARKKTLSGSSGAAVLARAGAPSGSKMLPPQIPSPSKTPRSKVAVT